MAIESASVMPGEAFTVPVTLAGAQSLGYLASDVSYDPTKLTLLEVTPGEFADSGLFALNPEASPGASGLIRFGWVNASGFTGDATVLNLTFQAEEDAAGSQVSLAFQNPNATDAALGDAGVGSEDGQVTSASRPVGDVNGDCVVDVLDVMSVAQLWWTELGDFEFDMDADLNGDGKINILGVMIAASQFAAECQQ